jgi:threonine dehydratase
MIGLDDIKAAESKISGYSKRTPLIRSETLSKILNTNIYLKLELFQKTGSFKVRGAFNKILGLEKNKQKIVTVSGGNHAQAVAYASALSGYQSTVFMPENSPALSVNATKAYGAEVIFTGTIREAFDKAQEYSSNGWVYVHPFDDPLVIAGQGTIGLEIMADLPAVTDIFVSIGGGGLMSGVSKAVKALKPETRIRGVETEGADTMSRTFAAGKIVEMPAITSIAKTLGAPAVCETTYAIALENLEEIIVVPDSEVIKDIIFLLERVKVLAEPAAACTLTAAGKVKEKLSPESHVVLILCGGNISLDDLIKFRAMV